MSNYQSPANPFAKGNQHYKKMLHPGRKRQFDTPGALWQAARKYFKYCKEHPVLYYTVYRGKLVPIGKTRPMSIKALCAYIRIANFDNYRKLPYYTEVLGRIRDVIYVHNYTAAAAGRLANHDKKAKFNCY
jgi:DNA-packaging protein gp3